MWKRIAAIIKAIAAALGMLESAKPPTPPK
jgi:hypothetical protein